MADAEAMRPLVRVLLVEDDPGDARLVREILADVPATDVDVEHVTSLTAAEASEAAGRDADVVLLDLTLPTSSGLETVRAARRRLPGLPIVVLTGLNDASMAQGAVAEGAQDYLLKSALNPEMLSRTIRYAMERSRVVRQLEAAVSAKEELLAEKEKMVEQLRRAAEMKDEFIAIASHELRTPVSLLNGYLDLLDRDGLVSDEGGEYLDASLLQARILNRLVDDLLVMSREERDALTVRPKKVRVVEAIDEARASSRCEDPTVVCDDDLHVKADREHLRRILTNLLDNATVHGQPPITVEVVRIDSSVGLRVRDAGEGVPPEFHDRMFDKFTQAGTSHTRPVRGTGLGLAIVHALTLKQGGEIWYEESESSGACFVVELPAG